MQTIFKCLAGSRLYGTSGPDSDMDYKAVHLPAKREILLGNGKPVISDSTGTQYAQNSAGDIDTESFELKRFFKLASDMQTVPVELLFVTPTSYKGPNTALSLTWADPWPEIVRNRDKILCRNSKAFVGYCKGQAVRYSMRGKRLAAYEAVVDLFKQGMRKDRADLRGMQELNWFSEHPGITYVEKDHCGTKVMYLDVYGRQMQDNVSHAEAVSIFEKPILEAGNRAKNARDLGGVDLKALYHAVRIVEQGITLFRDGIIEFPAQNVDYLMKIRSGEFEMDEILDHFDERLAVLEGIGENSPLPEKPDYDWMYDFIVDEYEKIVRAG